MVPILPAGSRCNGLGSAESCRAFVGVRNFLCNYKYTLYKAFDEELILEWAQRTGAVITIENVVTGGFGSAVGVVADAI